MVYMRNDVWIFSLRWQNTIIIGGACAVAQSIVAIIVHDSLRY